jgi:hypothetical protein
MMMMTWQIAPVSTSDGGNKLLPVYPDNHDAIVNLTQSLEFRA